MNLGQLAISWRAFRKHLWGKCDFHPNHPRFPIHPFALRLPLEDWQAQRFRLRL